MKGPPTPLSTLSPSYWPRTLLTLPMYSVEEEEIELQTSALREKLLSTKDSAKGSSGRGLKSHQVHELAQAKIEESEKLRKALGIREDYEEGSHWKRQEERLREGVPSKKSER